MTPSFPPRRSSDLIGDTILLTCIMIGTGLDPLTALSAVAGAINNTGPGLNSVVASVASIGTFGKWVLIVAMLVGRLEVFTLLVLFTQIGRSTRLNSSH